MYGSKSMLIWLTDFGLVYYILDISYRQSVCLDLNEKFINNYRYHLHKVTLPELVIPLGSEACDIAPIMIHKLGLYGILPCQIVSLVTLYL